jgi:hypothetical protein
LKGHARARLVEDQSAKKKGSHHASNHSGPEAEKELAKLPGAGKAHRTRHCPLFDRNAVRFTISILRKNRPAVTQEVGVHSASVEGRHLLTHLLPCLASSVAQEGHTRLGGWVLREMAKLRRTLECAIFVERATRRDVSVRDVQQRGAVVCERTTHASSGDARRGFPPPMKPAGPRSICCHT